MVAALSALAHSLCLLLESVRAMSFAVHIAGSTGDAAGWRRGPRGRSVALGKRIDAIEDDLATRGLKLSG